MPNKSNINPTWELGSPNISQALPSNIEETASKHNSQPKNPNNNQNTKQQLAPKDPANGN